MVDLTLIIGLAAGTLTTVSFVPQVIKAWKTKQTKDISLGMYLLIAVGISLWLVWGIRVNELPAILANAVSLILTLTVVYFKIKYG